MGWSRTCRLQGLIDAGDVGAAYLQMPWLAREAEAVREVRGVAAYRTCPAGELVTPFLVHSVQLQSVHQSSSVVM